MPRTSSIQAVLRVLDRATTELCTKDLIQLSGLAQGTVNAVVSAGQEQGWFIRKWRGSYRCYRISDEGRKHLRSITETEEHVREATANTPRPSPDIRRATPPGIRASHRLRLVGSDTAIEPEQGA